MQRFETRNQPEMVAIWFINNHYSKAIPTELIGVIISFYSLWAKYTLSKEQKLTMQQALQHPTYYCTGFDEPIIFDLVEFSMCGLDFKFQLRLDKIPWVINGITFKSVGLSVDVFLPESVRGISGYVGQNELSWTRTNGDFEAFDFKNIDGSYNLSDFRSYRLEELQSGGELIIDYCCDIQQIAFKKDAGLDDIGPFTLKKDTCVRWQITEDELNGLRQDSNRYCIVNQPARDLGFKLSVKYEEDWLVLRTDYEFMPIEVSSFEFYGKVQCVIDGIPRISVFTAELRFGEVIDTTIYVLHRDTIANEATLCLDIELVIVKVMTQYPILSYDYDDDVELEKADWEKYGVI